MGKANEEVAAIKQQLAELKDTKGKADQDVAANMEKKRRLEEQISVSKGSLETLQRNIQESQQEKNGVIGALRIVEERVQATVTEESQVQERVTAAKAEEGRVQDRLKAAKTEEGQVQERVKAAKRLTEAKTNRLKRKLLQM